MCVCHIMQPKEYDSELMCFYYDNHRTPGLVIRPVKVEVVFPKPRLFILRSVSLLPSFSFLLLPSFSFSCHLSLSFFCHLLLSFSSHAIIYCDLFFRGILSEREMDRLKELAGPKVRHHALLVTRNCHLME